MKKIQVVDLLRALSIFLVLTGHLQVLYINNGSKYYFLEYLWFHLWVNHSMGVSIFFVVSGFLITRLIATDFPGLFHPDLRTFYSRRVGRILPLLSLIGLIGILVTKAFPHDTPQFQHCFNLVHMSPRALFLTISTFTFNWYKLLHANDKIWVGLYWNVLWSLSIEEQFYLFYPLALRRLGNERNLYLFLLLIIALGPVSAVVGYRIFPHNNIVFSNSFAAFNLIAMGCLLYPLSQRLQPFLRARPKISWLLCLLGLLVFLVVYGHIYVRVDVWWNIWGNTFIGVAAFLFLLGGLHLEFFEGRSWTPLAFFGKLSYGMYLFHSLFLFFLWDFLVDKNQFFALGILGGLIAAVAWISLRFFETPANLLVRRLMGRPSKRPTSP